MILKHAAVSDVVQSATDVWFPFLGWVCAGVAVWLIIRLWRRF